MSFKFLNNMKREHKMFVMFLCVHLLVWTLVSLIRTVLPTDALEGIYWGSLHDFGTPKHPPLAGWLTYLAYVPFKSDFVIYLMSQSFIILGFIYIYKLARKFLEEKQAILSVVVLEGCWVYSYITGYYGFNPDVILLCLLPMITYCFYNCMKSDKPLDWIKLGILVGISFLNKYQTALVIIPMAIWALMFNRKTFKNKFFYISIIIAFLIFLPHILWLIKYDFFPFLYFEGELTTNNWLNHITAPMIFLLLQISLIAGVIVIFALTKLKFKSPFKFIENYKNEDVWFLILIGFTPLVIHLVMGFINGGTMRPRWGYEFWYMTGIILFYFFPTEISKKEFDFTFKLAYSAMFIIFLSLGTLLAVEKNYRSRYPVDTVFNDIKEIWAENAGTPLKYIGGYIEWTLPLTIYGNTHPDCMLDTFGYKNPWIDEQDLEKSGVFIIDRTIEKVQKQTKMACPYLPDDYKIEPVNYRFEVKNALGMPREYSIYYFIVPPKG